MGYEDARAACRGRADEWKSERPEALMTAIVDRSLCRRCEEIRSQRASKKSIVEGVKVRVGILGS
jgi:hypothetical protein